jgi:hypothetical protein
MINQKINEKYQLHSSAHLIYLVSRRPWPFVCSNCLLGLTTSFTNFASFTSTLQTKKTL